MDTSSPVGARTKGLPIGAALVAAVAASSCCLGPVILAALGLGGAGVFAGVAAYRPLMLGITALFLVVGFYLSYRRPKAIEGDACGCERPKAGRLPRLLLWVAAAVTLLVAAAPPVLARLPAQSTSHATPSGLMATASIHVDGIDCEACVAPIRKALDAAGGLNDLKLDLSTKMVTVSYVPGPGRPDVYIKAIDDLGYDAKASSFAGAKRELP